MRRFVTIVLMTAVLAAPVAAQKKHAPARKPAPKAAPVAPKTITPDITCASLIGMGVKTVRSFCDVPAGRGPAQGVFVALPPPSGTGTPALGLPARDLFFREEVKRGKGHAPGRGLVGGVGRERGL